ncbi:echinoderm microtubule-associated protein-like 2 isoform X4 [Portunus trituberculatus]|uniref:echinoderm microtubule-associated protein-like 2 isoform X4 n=1 Tax=Portunus trituberculatus TaxID=210409 RepID=UPI001E1CDB48|nr:echinoderm microtubule-associated protein-like 2 isoform X4 [Portunus trituberculatus]
MWPRSPHPPSPRPNRHSLSSHHRGARKMVGGASPPPVTISRVLDAWNEMIENENHSLRDRVGDLEKKVHEQNDEIMCLRSTLADVLRRLTVVESSSSKLAVGGGRVTPTKEDRGTVRLRHHHNSGGGEGGGARDVSKRASSYVPTRPASSTANISRRGTHYQSTSSLYSDGHSSSSVSPAPSPSPTAAPSSTTPHHHHHHHHHHLPSRHISTSSSPYSSPSRPSQLGALNKRWVSTSDFATPSRAATAYAHSPTPTNTLLAARRPNSGSLHNLSALRGVSAPQPHVTSFTRGREAQYNGEEGVVKLYLRGRPLNLYVPTPLRETYSPTGPSPAPPAKLKVEWVYGYRGRDCRNNVYQLPTGEIVYFVAAVVVLYNVEEQMQRHYLGHTDDIKCLAVHPNKLIIATGQTAGHDRRDARPHIRIWDSVSLHTLHVLGISDIERSVACLAFSKADGGGLLVAVDEAPDHNMSVWDWSRGERGYKLLETKCSADQVLAVDFSPIDRNTIITCGKNHISFWSYDSGMLAKRTGIFENRERPKYVTSISFTDTGNVISGDSNGNLLIWHRGGNTVDKMVRGAHEGPVFSILVQKDGTIITGGKDGNIVEWDRDLERTGNVTQVPEQYGAPRVVTSGRGSQLVVGTTRNCVLEGTFTFDMRPVMQGHTEELWGLTPHPSHHQFLTAGYDRTCYLWDTMAHTIVWSKDIGEPAQSAAFSNNGDIVVIGTTSGRWLVMDAETREMYSRHQDGNEPIQVLKFSPNGEYLAVGSRDNYIYMYQVTEGGRKYTRMGRCQGHSSFVTHLDWSADNQFLQSNSGDYELLYWNAGLCRQIVQTSQMRDVEWATSSCTLSFNTLGIWPEGADGTDVNTCTRANNNSVLVTGDDFGKVKVFSNPACFQKARCLEYGGHSSHVTAVTFIHDDSRLISTGGRDTAVMQWTVTSTPTSSSSQH